MLTGIISYVAGEYNMKGIPLYKMPCVHVLTANRPMLQFFCAVYQWSENR